jgi:hypothetical protein
MILVVTTFLLGLVLGAAAARDAASPGTRT